MEVLDTEHSLSRRAWNHGPHLPASWQVPQPHLSCCHRQVWSLSYSLAALMIRKLKTKNSTNLELKYAFSATRKLDEKADNTDQKMGCRSREEEPDVNRTSRFIRQKWTWEGTASQPKAEEKPVLQTQGFYIFSFKECWWLGLSHIREGSWRWATIMQGAGFWEAG